MNTTLTPVLTPADRCDSCGAQAYFRVTTGEGFSLHFCGHHGRAHLDKLRDLEDVDIIDETHRLVESETGVGAAARD